MNSNLILPAYSKDFGKKKRTNRSAKLKQCKLDARREQWLSQVKCKGYKEEAKDPVGCGTHKVSGHPEMNSGREEEKEKGCQHDNSDLNLMVNNQTESFSDSEGWNLIKNCVGNCRSSRSIISDSGCFSGCVTEQEEEDDDDDGCADDWEAVADAWTADDQEEYANSNSETPAVCPATEYHNKVSEVGVLKPEECNGTVEAMGLAWRPDDAFRPLSLPNLSKRNYSFPMNAERHCGRGAGPWVYHSIISQPTSCPICYEDLDLTDSSFLPCLCGFRICLFCHKRILEADGRCPGCRKLYDPVNGETGVNHRALPFQLTPSLSMSTRS